jgi:undecaprenyl-diphosphatase
MNQLLALDQSLFLLINHLPHTPFLDAIALAFSGLGVIGFVWIVQGLVLFLREEERDHWFFLPFLGALSFGSFFVEIVLKPIFARPRPDIIMDALILDRLFDGYSFPSAHATVAFVAAYLLSKKERSLRMVFFILATLVSLSRIYVGKHYPLDVAAGALIGLGIGYGVDALSRKLRDLYQHSKTRRTVRKG